MIITRTPYRVSLFGGGTDFPNWYRENGGSVLSFSIDKYCYISARILPPFFDHKYRIAYSRIETTVSVEEIKHPVIRESLKRYFPNIGVEIHHHGDLPARSGVGSSSAFAVGLISALKALSGDTLVNPRSLAEEAIFLEQELLSEVVGSQDQIACAYGGINFIDFPPGNHSWRIEHLKIKESLVAELEKRMVLVYSGISRTSSEISVGLIENLSRKKNLLKRTRELAEHCKQILTESGDLDEVGEMLDESWKLKRLINPQSVNSPLEELYASAKRCGALGGKILGAGGGGFLMFWLPTTGREKFLQTFNFGTRVPVHVDRSGSTILLEN